MQKLHQQEAGNIELAAWDWWHYSEKIRQLKYDFSEEEIIPYNEMPELEKYILHKLFLINDQVRKGYESYDLKSVFQALLNFSNLDLSSFYFDIRKDSLYCDSPNSNVRKSTRTVLDILFNYLLRSIKSNCKQEKSSA